MGNKVMRKICPNNCFSFLFTFENFCFKCGAKLIKEEGKVCPKCQNTISYIYLFCPNCGYQLK